MRKGRYVFQIGMREDGEFEVINSDSDVTKEIDDKEIGELLHGKEIKEFKTLPKITFIRANPCLVCCGGQWFRVC